MLDIQIASHFLDLPKRTRKVLEGMTNVAEGENCSAMEPMINEAFHAPSFIVFVARKNKTIVGWLSAERIHNKYEINVYVKPKYRRKGIGTALLKRAKRHLRKQVEVCKWDARARLFYDSLGM